MFGLFMFVYFIFHCVLIFWRWAHNRQIKNKINRYSSQLLVMSMVPKCFICSLLSLIFLIFKQSTLKCPISLHLKHLRFFLVHFSLSFFPFFVYLSYIFIFFFITHRHLLSLVSLLVTSKARYMILFFFFSI